MPKSRVYSYDKIGQEPIDERKRLVSHPPPSERGIRAKMGIFLAIVLVASFFIFCIGVLFHRHLMQPEMKTYQNMTLEILTYLKESAKTNPKMILPFIEELKSAIRPKKKVNLTVTTTQSDSVQWIRVKNYTHEEIKASVIFASSRFARLTELTVNWAFKIFQETNDLRDICKSFVNECHIKENREKGYQCGCIAGHHLAFVVPGFLLAHIEVDNMAFYFFYEKFL